MADKENYMVSDKIGAMQGIILKEEYIVIVWDYALVVCESKIFARTVLYHWFAGNVAQYRSLYNTLFLIIGVLVVKFVHFIILNPNKNC